MDLTQQSHTLDPALKASRARRILAIRLLVNDIFKYFSATYAELRLVHNLGIFVPVIEFVQIMAGRVFPAASDTLVKALSWKSLHRSK